MDKACGAAVHLRKDELTNSAPVVVTNELIYSFGKSKVPGAFPLEHD